MYCKGNAPWQPITNHWANSFWTAFAGSRGVPQVEVTFDIDANGIINVTAADKATGRSQKITITASSGLNEQEIERMKKEAEDHAEEDNKRKELIEVRNNADSAVYTAEKTNAR